MAKNPGKIRMKKKIIILLCLAISMAVPYLFADPPENIIFNPDSSVRLAAADLAATDPAMRPNIRYLSLYNVPPELRQRMGAIVSFVCNSLGTRKRFYIPYFVANSNQTVIRLNITDYEWDGKSWDKLASEGSGARPFPEPYFHTFLEQSSDNIKIDDILSDEEVARGNTIVVVKNNAGLFLPKTSNAFTTVRKGTKFTALDAREGFVLVNLNGRNLWIAAQDVKKVEATTAQDLNKRRVFAGAPWVNRDALAYLIQWTQSESPILRADWFVTNVTVPPAYYNFLRLGNDIKDFQKLIFANEELAIKARSQQKGVVISSTVARNNRTLTRSPTFTRYYWQSHDTLTSRDDRQYVQNLLNEKFDATEDIGSLPNGLQAYFLTDGKGKRLDKADTDIAIDNTAVDRTVRTGRSCIICHAAGINPIDDEVRSLTRKLKDQESVRLLIVNEAQAYKINDLFDTNLDDQIIEDQMFYKSAVGRVTGMKPDLAIKEYASIWDRYAEKLLDKEDVAREVGVSVTMLEKYIRMSSDNVVLGLIKSPARPVRRDQWEQSFQNLMYIMIQNTRAYQVLPTNKELIYRK
jgi:hypothetical protein